VERRRICKNRGDGIRTEKMERGRRRKRHFHDRGAVAADATIESELCREGRQEGGGKLGTGGGIPRNRAEGAKEESGRFARTTRGAQRQRKAERAVTKRTTKIRRPDPEQPAVQGTPTPQSGDRFVSRLTLHHMSGDRFPQRMAAMAVNPGEMAVGFRRFTQLCRMASAV
jgi:hypothetical protein